MITVDLHTHTSHSHAQNSVAEMFAAGQKRGLLIHGFSEHSPRPDGYGYPKDYQPKLVRGFPDYVEEVLTLAETHKDTATVLLGLELDWIEGQESFMASTVQQYPYDYIIGGIHFLGTWGFDWTVDDWTALSQAQAEAHYEAYFATFARMAGTGLFHIAAHPDIIKIFSPEAFATWVATPRAHECVRAALTALRDAGMAMEISSAGLRKPCKEIYPGPVLMRMAAELSLPITFGSDAHCINTLGWGFDTLESYARSYGFTSSVWFRQGSMQVRPF